jgi:hypothetical protein
MALSPPSRGHSSQAEFRRDSIKIYLNVAPDRGGAMALFAPEYHR